MIKTFQTFKEQVNDKNILIVGGGPSANILSAEDYRAFDRIIRINNFKYANKCKRTDIWYSYWGRNIERIAERIKEEPIHILVSKYPVNQEFCWTFELRKELWKEVKIPICIPTEIESFQTNNPFQISPTAGFSAIFEVLAQKPKQLTIIGFDFFESNIHNLNEPWDQSGEHHPEFEKKIITALEDERRLIWLK